MAGSSGNPARNIATTATGNISVAAFNGGMMVFHDNGEGAFYYLPAVGAMARAYINNDGSRILLAGGNTARLLNGNLETLVSVTMGSVQVEGASLSKDAQTAAFFDSSGYLHIWDSSSGHINEHLYQLGTVPVMGRSLAVSGDGRYVAGAFESASKTFTYLAEFFKNNFQFILRDTDASINYLYYDRRI